MKAAYWMLVPLCLALTGCEQWDKLFLDDAGQAPIPEQEFAWFLINAFRLVFADPWRLLGCVVGLFLLLAVGGDLWAKGGVWKLIGIVMVVLGITAYGCIVGLLYIFLAMALGVVLSGFRRG